jgi:hypothetical protein
LLAPFNFSLRLGSTHTYSQVPLYLSGLLEVFK